jgi:hypothetical protein
MALGRERSEVRRYKGKKIDLNGFNDFSGLNDVSNRTGEDILSLVARSALTYPSLLFFWAS